MRLGSQHLPSPVAVTVEGALAFPAKSLCSIAPCGRRMAFPDWGIATPDFLVRTPLTPGQETKYAVVTLRVLSGPVAFPIRTVHCGDEVLTPGPSGVSQTASTLLQA